MRRALLSVALWLGLFVPQVAHGADGAVEINQACAAAGCYSGDGPGFPVTLADAGAYVLTSNLVLPDADTTAIEVSAERVSIDMRGFAILGPTRCTGAPPGEPLVCAPTGSGRGIDYVGPDSDRGLGVSGGSIIGVGDDGVFAGYNARLGDLRVMHCGGDGIAALLGAVVRHSVAARNGGNGVQAFTSTIVANTASRNGGSGIQGGGTIRHNLTFNNAGVGIGVGSFSLVSENVSRQNGSDGIQTAVGVDVNANDSTANQGFGLNLATGVRFRENQLLDNGGGTVTGGAEVFPNNCDGSTTCP